MLMTFVNSPGPNVTSKGSEVKLALGSGVYKNLLLVSKLWASILSFVGVNFTTRVELKSFSEIEFIQYFSTAKAVIANGGFSFISEAVFLKKPICCVPIKNQFEQFIYPTKLLNLDYLHHLLLKQQHYNYFYSKYFL